MRRVVLSLMTIGTLAAASSALAGAQPNVAGEAKLAKRLEGRVAGKPVHCINLREAGGSEVIDGTAIVYDGPGGSLYVNRPRGGADTLRRDDVLVTRSFNAQLCNLDSVNLVDSASRSPRGFVSLGDFTPYAKPKP